MFWERYGEIQLFFPLPIGYDTNHRPGGSGKLILWIFMSKECSSEIPLQSMPWINHVLADRQKRIVANGRIPPIVDIHRQSDLAVLEIAQKLFDASYWVGMLIATLV